MTRISALLLFMTPGFLCAQDPSVPKSVGTATIKFEKAAAELPERYYADLEKIQQDYSKQLTVAHGDAVKRKDLGEAEQLLKMIQEIQEEIVAQKSPPVNNFIKKGARWRGTHQYMGNEYPATLTIISRAGDKFEATLEWGVESTGYVMGGVEGKISGSEITFELKAVQKGRNVILPVTYSGKIAARTLRGEWENSNGTSKGEFNYTLLR